MPYLYYGFRPRGRGATKLAVRIDDDRELEPAQPSNVKVFASSPFVPIWSIIVKLLGLIVSVLSFPRFSYVHWSAEGLLHKPAPNVLPFKQPGLAIVMKKNAILSDDNSTDLDSRGFSTMQFSGRTVWLKEEGTRDDFIAADRMVGVDPLGPCPARYLNTSSYRSFLTLMSLTARICFLFHYLASQGSPFPIISQKVRSKAKGDWKNARDLDEENADDVMGGSETFAFNKPEVFEVKATCEQHAAELVRFAVHEQGISACNSGVVVNTLPSDLKGGFINAGDTSAILSHGIIAKFHHRLALPDPNLIGDIIGRHFLASLGDDHDEQVENLEMIKSGLAGLRLTRLGEELTHMYKTLDIAIACNAGMVPIFSGSVYEGSVIMGGPGATIHVHGASFSFSTTTSLKDEFLMVSEHTSALNSIANYFPEKDRATITCLTSMVFLRRMCLELEVNQDAKDDIIRKAANLDFGNEPWAINPANLNRFFTLISNPASLDESDPIGRLSLFSKDNVLIALSCFGEKSVPSWDIPSGVTCSLKKAVPPTPPPQNTQRKASRGDVSDANWVMVVRGTELFPAVDEFRKMAATFSYRSTSSTLAKKVGHRVFSRERMAEFWIPMREALRSVNPSLILEEEGVSLKRGATDSMQREPEEGGVSLKKKRKIGF
jgi:hypothetical protein